MIIDFDNKVISSFLMAVDHEILNKGSGFTNTTGFFYPATGSIAGLNLYTTPYKQLVQDSSISGVTIPTGLWVNGSFLQPGTSGFYSFNIEEGQALFTGRPAIVSGSFSVKDFSVYLTNEPEERLLFETKYYLRGQISQTPTGLFQNAQTFPVIYIKPAGGENEPFCLGGVDNNKMRLRAIIIAETEFQMNAVVGILKRMAHRYFKIIEPTGVPLNALGGYTGISFNYTGLAAGYINQTYIWNVKALTLMGVRQFNEVNPKAFPAFVDFELWSFL